ncbi:MAG: DUF29 domain-containing protein [Proteobacteria bacterium]|nr:DUF29 domain-containing protein [Pseudomonadota bacterium]
MNMQTYREDFHAWAYQNAQLLREGRFEEIDIENIAEELEDMGSSKARELESRLGVLLAHLLKWVYQPERRSNSWRATIREQRRRIARLIKKNPSLKSVLDEAFLDGFGDARLIAMRETGINDEVFPLISPFTIENTLNDDYWPE